MGLIVRILTAYPGNQTGKMALRLLWNLMVLVSIISLCPAVMIKPIDADTQGCYRHSWSYKYKTCGVGSIVKYCVYNFVEEIRRRGCVTTDHFTRTGRSAVYPGNLMALCFKYNQSKGYRAINILFIYYTYHSINSSIPGFIFIGGFIYFQKTILVQQITHHCFGVAGYPHSNPSISSVEIKEEMQAPKGTIETVGMPGWNQPLRLGRI